MSGTGRSVRGRATRTGRREVTGDDAVAFMDRVGVDGALFVSAFSLYRFDASYAVEVQARHPGRFGIIKPLNTRDTCRSGGFGGLGGAARRGRRANHDGISGCG